jgi:TRAP-type C4-dicarboxylate transport system permease small subunit
MISHKPGEAMNATRIAAIVLIVAGVLGLVYGGFSYTKDTTAVKLGPIELSVKEKQTVNVPMWLGVGAIVVGGLLLVVGGRKS